MATEGPVTTYVDDLPPSPAATNSKHEASKVVDVPDGLPLSSEEDQIPCSDTQLWIPRHVQIPICYSATPEKKNVAYCKCGYKLTDTSDGRHERKSLEAKRHITTSNEPLAWIPTNACGTINFLESEKTARYARVGYIFGEKTEAEREQNKRLILQIRTMLLSAWQLAVPKLTISIIGCIIDPTGGRIRCESLEKEHFVRNVARAAIHKNAWVFSSGLDDDLTDWCDDAAANPGLYAKENYIVCMGIAPWQRTYRRASLISSSLVHDSPGSLNQVQYAARGSNLPKNLETSDLDAESLQPNHTHYLILDSVSNFSLDEDESKLKREHRRESFRSSADTLASAADEADTSRPTSRMMSDGEGESETESTKDMGIEEVKTVSASKLGSSPENDGDEVDRVQTTIKDMAEVKRMQLLRLREVQARMEFQCALADSLSAERSRLQHKPGKRVELLTVVVGGGPLALHQMHYMLHQGRAVLIWVGSGGAADLVWFACQSFAHMSTSTRGLKSASRLQTLSAPEEDEAIVQSPRQVLSHGVREVMRKKLVVFFDMIGKNFPSNVRRQLEDKWLIYLEECVYKRDLIRPIPLRPDALDFSKGRSGDELYKSISAAVRHQREEREPTQADLEAADPRWIFERALLSNDLELAKSVLDKYSSNKEKEQTQADEQTKKRQLTLANIESFLEESLLLDRLDFVREIIARKLLNLALFLSRAKLESLYSDISGDHEFLFDKLLWRNHGFSVSMSHLYRRVSKQVRGSQRLRRISQSFRSRLHTRLRQPGQGAMPMREDTGLSGVAIEERPREGTSVHVELIEHNPKPEKDGKKEKHKEVDESEENALNKAGHLIDELIGDFNEHPFVTMKLSEGPRRKHTRTSWGDFDDPEFEIFVWSILQNRKDTALLFLRSCRESLSGCLLAVSLLRALSRVSQSSLSQTRLLDNANEFEDLALNIVDECQQVHWGHLLDKSVDNNPAKVEMKGATGSVHKQTARYLYQSLPAENKRAFLTQQPYLLLLHTVLTRKIPALGGRTSLDLAITSHARRFIAHAGVQGVANAIWMGRIIGPSYKNPLIVLSLFFPPALFLLHYGGVSSNLRKGKIEIDDLTESLEDFEESIEGEKAKASSQPEAVVYLPTATGVGRRPMSLSVSDPKRPSCCSSPCCRFVKRACVRIASFYSAPVVVMAYELIAYLLFLLLLSCTALFWFNPHALEWDEHLLAFWGFCMLVEEFHQMSTRKGNWYVRIRDHIQKDFWNPQEIATVFFLFLGLYLGNQEALYPSIVEGDPDSTIHNDKHVLGRIFFAMAVFFAYFRLLYFYTIQSQLGPKVLMLQHMLSELMLMVAIMLVFIVAWGVAQYALLFPQSPFSWSLIRDVLTLPYWQMYTATRSDTVMQAPPFDMHGRGVCTNDPLLYTNYTMTRCADWNTSWVVMVFLAIYCLLTYLLLFNLIIALFNKAIEKIQGQAQAYWNFLKVSLALEYYEKSPLPPPLNLLSLLYQLIYQVVLKCAHYRLPSKRDFMIDSEQELPPIVDFNLQVWLKAILVGIFEQRTEEEKSEEQGLSVKLNAIEKALSKSEQENTQLSTKINEVLKQNQDILSSLQDLRKQFQKRK